MPARKQTLDERFKRWTDRTGECWIWTGAYFPDGQYGKMKVKGRTRGAHRIAWENKFGPVSDGMFVLHKCDVPGCVNPDHLFLGTHQDNMDDKVFKGRQARGEGFVSSKLTKSQVEEIRYRYAAGGITQQELADEFRISQRHVSDICRRKWWKD